MHLQATENGRIQLRFSVNQARCAGTACTAASLILDVAAGFCVSACLHTDRQSLESTLSS